MSIFTLKRDGLNIVCEQLNPFGERYDLAIIMHGFTANRNTDLLKQLAQNLCNENVSSIRFDFNGHGESDGAFKDMTVLNEIADANCVLSYVKTNPHINHIYLVGHSQGGVIASMLAGLYPDLIDKLVLLAPAACLKDDALAGSTQGVSYNPKKIPDIIPYKGKELGGFYLRIAQNLPIYETSKNFTGPVCLIHGKSDQVVDYKYSQKYHDIYENSTLHLIEADHRFTGDSQKEAIRLTTDFLRPTTFF
ncbi:alpha/beta hydrolase [Lactobacillus psittaci]|nr:alpha/beta fold hydrolase [Lactobacillus psittaci]